jgi:hypothetical protein
MIYVESDFSVEDYNNVVVKPYYSTLLELRNAVAAVFTKNGKYGLSDEQKEHIAEFCVSVGHSAKEQTTRFSMLTNVWHHAVVYVMPSGRFELVAD